MSGLSEIPAPDFDLAGTLSSGQIFHAMPYEEGWQVLVDRIPLYAAQKGKRLLVSAGHETVARKFFALDHPLRKIYQAFPPDPFSRAALTSCRGLRVMRQPLWECLATFITSPMKQVAHIRQISLLLRERFGEPIEGSLIKAYPEPHRLAELTENDLRECQMGFRAKSLLRTARAVADGSVVLQALTKLTTEEAREALCELPGVGRKVANCVLLFAYERLNAVPVDVWIARILQAMHGGKASNLELERYSNEHFGAYAGYVQQYLFHHARMSRSLPSA